MHALGGDLRPRVKDIECRGGPVQVPTPSGSGSRRLEAGQVATLRPAQLVASTRSWLGGRLDGGGEASGARISLHRAVSRCRSPPTAARVIARPRFKVGLARRSRRGRGVNGRVGCSEAGQGGTRGAWFLKGWLRRGGQHVATQLCRAADNRRAFIGSAAAIGLVARRLPLTASVGHTVRRTPVRATWEATGE
jgi:hypothetical protein